MKKATLFLAGLMASAMLFAGCGSGSAAKGSSFAQANVEATGLEASAEGYTESGDGYTMEVAWCGADKTDIFGRLFYPADFDESKTYPAIVMCHGGGVNADIYSKVYAPYLAKEGYVCYVFDCRSATENGRGSYSTELAEGTEVSVSTYAEDLNMALDFVESREYVDQEHLYLFGQSMGGVTSEYVASKRSDEIAGMIVLYGSVDESNSSMMPEYETVIESPYSNGEVLFIQGALDKNLPVARTLSNMEWYEHSTFIDISKAGHGFGNVEDRATLITSEAVADFIERDIAGEEQEDLSQATEEERSVQDEGYTITGDGFTSVVTWFENGDSDMFGRIYYPEDYDENETYPTIVMCHGAGVNADIWDAVYAPALTKEGYICFTYDCRSSGAGFRGSFSTPVEGDDASVDDYISDTNAALDFIETKEFVDLDSIYLIGQSKGGLTVQTVASQRADEIKGMIVLYGALSDSFADSITGYDEVVANPYDQGETLFILGSKDSTSAEDTLANAEWYEYHTFLYISDAAHGFGNHNTRPAQIAADEMVNFVNRTMASEEEFGTADEETEDMAEGETPDADAETDDVTTAEEGVDAAEESDLTAEGYTEDLETYTSTVAWCQNGDMNIYGEFYYPADYEEGKTYPVVIMSHGGSVTHEFYEKAKWDEYITSLGYIGYAYDFCGGSKNSLSDGVQEEYMTPLTESSDLKAVYEFVKGQEFTDTNNIFLMGQSFGGLVTSITASEFNNEVSGIILLYPALSVPDIMHETYASEDELPTEVTEDNGNDHPAQYFLDMYNIHIEEDLPTYTGKVLIIHGEGDKTIPISYSEKAVNEIYAEGQTELVTITGDQSGHAFEIINEEGRAIAQEAVGNFLAGLMK